MKNKLLTLLHTCLGCLLFVPGSLFAQNLIPQPARMETRPGTFWLSARTAIVCHDFPDLADYLNHHLEKGYGLRLSAEPQTDQAAGRISLTDDATLPAEGYTLQISPTEIGIRAGGRAGAFYALQTLFQLMTPAVYGETDTAPTGQPQALGCITIEDAPRYPYRGVMLDVARTFFDKATVMRYIDWLSRHKINKLHWHLTDDDGWRIEIKQYPELTAKGAWRGPGETSPTAYGSGEKRYGGFYTQDEIREVVRYAAFRNIEIIPEIDLPGHSRAARGAYPEIFCKTTGAEPAPELMRNVWCAGREENFEMLQNILQEIAALFPSPYIHIGGDEVSYRYWRACPRCKAVMHKHGMQNASHLQGYFMGRLEEIVRKEGKRCGAWNEVLKSKSDTTMLIYGWENTDACREALQKGYPLVAMPGSYLYIDMKQSPFERGHTWAWLVDTRRVYSFDPGALAPSAASAGLIRGVEGAQWAELMSFPPRFLEYQGYPRICALAEVGWSRPEHRNWEDFYQRLTAGHFDRLSAMGIAFRVFPPETTYRNGTLTATSSIPGASVEYTTDPDWLTAEYQPYTGPISDTVPEKYAFRTRYKDAHSPGVPAMYTQIVTLAPNETRSVSLPLSELIDRDGIWFLSVVPGEENTRINNLAVSGPDTTYTIIRNGQRANPFGNLRIYADERNRTATATLTLSNNNATENRITIGLRPSPFLEPEVRVSSSMGFAKRFPVSGVTDYNLGTYSRTARTCRTGDYVLYTFDRPVVCSSIEIQTGLPDVTRYIVTQGSVDYSGDGTAYTHGGTLDDSGRLMLYPKYPVKSVRIRIGGGNGETQVALQDLRIRR